MELAKTHASEPAALKVIFSSIVLECKIFYSLNFQVSIDFLSIKHWNRLDAYMSRVMRKPAFCICENKGADQLHGNREADQRLCFRYINSAIPLVPKFEISSLQPSSVAVQPGWCRTWLETPKTGFLTTRLIS